MVTDTEVIDATEWPRDKRATFTKKAMESITKEAELRHDAILDRLSDEEQTLTVEWHGDALAEAMGRSYKTRDIIEDRTGRNVEVEHTGKAWKLPYSILYEFELTIEAGE